MGARYRYATDRDGRLLGIDELPREDRRTRAPFSCVGCGKELIPKMGSVVSHHFAHKYDQTCAGETYLHRLAKLAFLESYRRCLTEGQPYFLSYTREERCNHFRKEFGFTCGRERNTRIDLTRVFDLVEPERERDGFRADVLLHSSGADKQLFIEFVVTHESTHEKRSSGIPIIEVVLIDEDHAIAIARDGLDGNSPYVRLINFRKPTPRDLCEGACSTSVGVFLVYPGGKCVLADAAVRTAASPSFKPRALCRRIVGRTDRLGPVDRPSVFRKKVREAHFAGIAVRNCYVCRRHGIGFGDHPIFCKELRKACDSNEAADCPLFSPFSSSRECEAADARNLAYIENREKQRLKEWQERTRRFRKRPSGEATEGRQARSFIEWEKEWKRRHSNPEGDS